MDEKIYITLTDDIRGELLAEYKNEPYLWDPSRKDYRDYSAIAKAKQSVASKFEWATHTCILILYVSTLHVSYD